MLENKNECRAAYLRQLRFCYLFPGSRSSPDEDRLSEHLFKKPHQLHNLLSTPIRNISDSVDVLFGIELLDFIALVKTVTFLLYFVLLPLFG